MSSEDDAEETWLDFYEANISVPPHISRRKGGEGHDETVPFCLSLETFEFGFDSTEEGQFQLRCTLYDAENRYFFGATWIGMVLSSQVVATGLHVVDIQELLYFHTVGHQSTVAVIEVTRLTHKQWETVGWGWIRMFAQIDQLADTEEIARPKQKRLEFYYGSSMALLFIPEPIGKFHMLQAIPKCSLTYTLQTHDALTKVKKYVPENIALSGDDIIPGLDENAEEVNGVIDILKAPNLLQPWPCILKKVNIKLSPSIEEFEEKLCHMLNEDRMRKDQLIQDDGVVTILERKLKVGVHNGWRFVRSPQVMFLDTNFTQAFQKSMNSSNRPSSRLSNSANYCTSLTLRNQLELDEVVRHPLFAIAFQLEYVVNIPCVQLDATMENKKTRNKLSSSLGSIPLSQKRCVALRVAVWVPFEKGNIANGKVSLQLEGGITTNPFEEMLYTANDVTGKPAAESLGRVSFNFHQTKLKPKPHPAQHPAARDQIPAIAISPVDPPPFLAVESQEDEVEGYYEEEGSLFYGGSVDHQQFGSLSLRPPLPASASPRRSPRSGEHIGNMSPRATSPIPLQEVPISKRYHVPYIVATPNIEVNKPVALSRVAMSLLHSVEYPKITDAEGKPPFQVDVQEKTPYDVSREMRDHLHANEINIQFLALARCSCRTVFFTFQFYRFPQTTSERLHLKDVSDAENMGGEIPCVLQKSARDGTPSTSAPPGLLIKYTVDPSFMQPGEKKSFLTYLLQQKLHIHMWDGDSLLPIGSTFVHLKHLLRQGQPAVQASQQVDVSYMEYTENDGSVTHNPVQSDQPYPAGVKVYLRAKLYLRLANIGYLPDKNTEKLNHVTATTGLNQSGVVNMEGSGGSTGSGGDGGMKSLKTSAKLMSDCDSELATVLLTRKGLTGRTQKMNEEDANSKRKRKIDRMKAVRNLTGGEELQSPFILQKEEKLQRTRDLRTIQLYREKVKGGSIVTKLEESITSHHLLYCSLGKVEFFEFALRNPYPTDQAVLIRWEDKELNVVLNSKEWKYLKSISDTTSVLEEQMFSTSDEEVKIFVRGNELVHIPFKFQSFTSCGLTPEMGPSHPLHVKSNSYSLQTFGKDTTLSAKDIKVAFYGSDLKPMAILHLRVELHPHSIDQTFRFYQPEQTFLKKSLRLPPWHTLPGCAVQEKQTPPNVNVCCTDNTAIIETSNREGGEPQEIYVKVPCGMSPSVKRLFIVIFIDEFCTSPCQIWQIYIHSLQRIDISATEGQASKLSILLKGTQSSRMVKCFSSHPDELKLVPQDQFMLMANGVQELGLTVQPVTSEGKRMMFVNVVDQEFFQLMKSWLIMVSCTPPHISKLFEINLKVGGGPGSNKKISFANPYSVKKSFFFHTNREDLLMFKENSVMLGGGVVYNLKLCFLPVQSTGTAVILVFINDKEGKNEETFEVRCLYTH